MHFQCMLRLSDLAVQHLLAGVNLLAASGPPQRRPTSHIHRLLSITLKRLVRFFLLNFFLVDGVLIQRCFRQSACLLHLWNLLEKLGKVNAGKAQGRFGMSLVLVPVLPRLPVFLDNDCHSTFEMKALSALEQVFIRVQNSQSHQKFLACLAVEYHKALREAMLEQDEPFPVFLKEYGEVIHYFPSHLSYLKIPLTF